MMRHLRLGYRTLFGLLGAAWFLLGAVTPSTSLEAQWLWIGTSFLVAGSAFAVARYWSLYAVRMYLAVSVAVGAMRSAYFLFWRGTAGPFAVWMIVTVLTAIVYSMLRFRVSHAPR